MNDVHETVRERYGQIAASDRSGGACCTPTCCGTGETESAAAAASGSLGLGYTSDDLSAVPVGADLALGCGNPKAIASLKAGETVVDLGSGGGLDCFLAAKEVGETGTVIGVDMTAEMITRSRGNAKAAAVNNVEFRLGEIEHLPVADDSVDVIISNCVINLSPDKAAVFAEAFRVLRPGGRLAIADVVSTGPMPAEMRNSAELLTACVAGAVSAEEIEKHLVDAGFDAVSVRAKSDGREIVAGWGEGIEEHVTSATIEATKPVRS